MRLLILLARQPRLSTIILLISSLCFIPELIAEPLKAEPGEIEKLLDSTDDLNRGRSSHSLMQMKVKTDRYERDMKIEVWTQGTERSLLRVLSPKRDAGVATLKVDDQVWNYLPKVDRTMKISASAMGGAWMGSHLTNDDLVRGSRMREDYTWSLISRPKADGSGVYHIDLIPKPNAPIVWGKVSLIINAKKQPQKISYWNEREVLMREMSFHDYREIEGQAVPMRMRVTPSREKGAFTEITYETLQLNITLSPRLFSLQSLKR